MNERSGHETVRGAVTGALAVLLGLPAALTAGMAAAGLHGVAAAVVLAGAAAWTLLLSWQAARRIDGVRARARRYAAAGAVLSAFAVGAVAVFPALAASVESLGAGGVVAMAAVRHTDADPGVIRDANLLAKARRLVVSECAGYFANQNRKKHACLERRSPWVEASCAYFGGPARRCPFFEQVVLPLTAPAPTCAHGAYDSEVYEKFGGLAEAYAQHVQFGAKAQMGMCRWVDENTGERCRNRVAGFGPNSRYCEWHRRKAELERKKIWAREARAKEGPGVDVLDETPSAKP